MEHRQNRRIRLSTTLGHNPPQQWDRYAGRATTHQRIGHRDMWALTRVEAPIDAEIKGADQSFGGNGGPTNSWL